MASDEAAIETRQSSPAAHFLRYKLLLPTLAFSSAGIAAGSILAVQRVQPIPLYAATTGLNWTLLGGSFVLLRQAGLGVLWAKEVEKSTGALVGVSASSGALTGAGFNLLRRGTRGLTGAVLLYGSLAATGQFGVLAASSARDAYVHAQHAPMVPSSSFERVREADKSIWQKLKESSPMRRMSDAEYEALIQGRIDDLDEQLSLVEEEMRLAKSEIAARAR